jgi:hypothetical protein
LSEVFQTATIVGSSHYRMKNTFFFIPKKPL